MSQSIAQIPYGTMALLSRQREAFRKMSEKGVAPRLEAMVSFFLELELVVIQELPLVRSAVAGVCIKWAGLGLRAERRGCGAEINWASPIIQDDLFRELGVAVGIPAPGIQ